MAREQHDYEATDGRTFHHITGITDKAWLKERHTRINGTEAAVLINESPYCTPYELFHRKRGDIPEAFEIGMRGRVGKALEPAVAKLVGKELKCKLRKLGGYFWNDDGMGATMDYEIIEGSINVLGQNEEGTPVWKVQDGKGWLVEIKTVDFLIFRDNWCFEDQGQKVIEPPVHIELQGQHQCEVAARPGVIFATLVGGNDLRFITRPADPNVGLGLRELTHKFWEDVGTNREPEVDFVNDADLIAQLYAHSDSESVYDGLEMDTLLKLCKQYEKARVIEKNAATAKKAAKSEMLTVIGSCSRARMPGGWSISATEVAPSPGTLITPEMVGQVTGGRKGYRTFKVTHSTTTKKGKK